MQASPLQIYAPLIRLAQANAELLMGFMTSAEVADEVRENISAALRTATGSAIKLSLGPAFVRLVQGSLSNYASFLASGWGGQLAQNPWVLGHERDERPAWPLLQSQ